MYRLGGGAVSLAVTFVGAGDAFGAGARFQACVLLDSGDFRLAVDFGPSSLIALAGLGIEPGDIDAIVLTSLNGERCAGVPFLLRRPQGASGRRVPLVIAGPPDCTNRLATLGEVLFPGARGQASADRCRVVELAMRGREAIGPAVVTSLPAAGEAASRGIALRIELARKVVAVAGAGAWSASLPALARDADLFIAACPRYAGRDPREVTYLDLQAYARRLTCRRMILTQLGHDMLPRRASLPEETAHDGLVVTL